MLAAHRSVPPPHLRLDSGFLHPFASALVLNRFPVGTRHSPERCRIPYDDPRLHTFFIPQLPTKTWLMTFGFLETICFIVEAVSSPIMRDQV